MLSNNIVSCGIVILIVVLLLNQNNSLVNNDPNNNLILLLTLIIIMGISHNLYTNGFLIKNKGNLVETLNNQSNPDILEIDSEDIYNKTQPNNIVVEQEHQDHQEPNEPQFNQEHSDQPPVLLKSSDLLPSQEWPNEPTTIQTNDQVQQHLDATSVIGMLSQTNRNANHDLRCAPPIARIDVGPWQQTTMEPDLHRRPLEGPECGSCNNN